MNNFTINNSNITIQFNNHLTSCSMKRCSLFWHRIRQILLFCLPFFNKSFSLKIDNQIVAVEKKNYRQWRENNKRWIETYCCKDSSFAKEIAKIINTTSNSFSTPTFNENAKQTDDSKTQETDKTTNNSGTQSKTHPNQTNPSSSKNDYIKKIKALTSIHNLLLDNVPKLNNPIESTFKNTPSPYNLKQKENCSLSQLLENSLSLIDIPKEIRDVIDERIEEFDKTIEIKNRLGLIKQTKPFYHIALKEIFAPWNTSALRYLLSFDHELEKLTIEDIKNVGIDHLYAIVERLKPLITQTKDIPLENEPNDQTLLNLSVYDIHKLKADVINKLAKNFPPIAFSFISPSEADKIDINVLSFEQIKYLSKTHWTNLTPSQVSLLDFSKMDKKTFDLLFSPYNKLHTKMLFQKLPLNCLQQVNHHFDEWHKTTLMIRQILEMDLTKLNQKEFDMLFDRNDVALAEKLQAMPIDRIYEITKYFSKAHWQTLSVQQVEAYDITKLTKEQFESLFDMTSIGGNGLRNLQALPVNKLYKIAHYFSRNHWRALSTKQLQDYNLYNINREQFLDLFNPYDNLFWKEKFQTLSLMNLYAIEKYFYEAHWLSLNPKQLFYYDEDRIKNIPHLDIKVEVLKNKYDIKNAYKHTY